jgi:hypothetical protein
MLGCHEPVPRDRCWMCHNGSNSGRESWLGENKQARVDRTDPRFIACFGRWERLEKLWKKLR